MRGRVVGLVAEVNGKPLEEKEIKEQIGQSHRGCSNGGRQGAWADAFSTRYLWRRRARETWWQGLPELGVSVLLPS